MVENDLTRLTQAIIHLAAVAVAAAPAAAAVAAPFAALLTGAGLARGRCGVKVPSYTKLPPPLCSELLWEARVAVLAHCHVLVQVAVVGVDVGLTWWGQRSRLDTGHVLEPRCNFGGGRVCKRLAWSTLPEVAPTDRLAGLSLFLLLVVVAPVGVAVGVAICVVVVVTFISVNAALGSPYGRTWVACRGCSSGGCLGVTNSGAVRLLLWATLLAVCVWFTNLCRTTQLRHRRKPTYGRLPWLRLRLLLRECLSRCCCCVRLWQRRRLGSLYFLLCWRNRQRSRACTWSLLLLLLCNGSKGLCLRFPWRRYRHRWLLLR